MTLIRGVEHLVMNVADPDVTARFYCDVFGFEVLQRLDDKGIVSLRHPSARLSIGLRRRVGDPPAGTRVLDHVAFAVRDRNELDECARHLASIGVAASIEETANGYSITLHDPDDNEVEFFARSSSG